jgi:hypothetical protein
LFPDTTDPIHPNFFNDVWLAVATRNTSIYDELDGPNSYERITTITQLKEALVTTPLVHYKPKDSDRSGMSSMDAGADFSSRLQLPHTTTEVNDVDALTAQIKGHLVKFPLSFLEEEDLSVGGSLIGNVFS